METNIAELDLREEVFMTVGRYKPKFDYPVVTIPDYKHGPRPITFNRGAIEFFQDAKYIKFCVSTNYVLIEKSDGLTPNTFSVSMKHNSIRVTFPANLMNQIAPGHYRLYKSGRGLVFKRYEPIK